MTRLYFDAAGYCSATVTLALATYSDNSAGPPPRLTIGSAAARGNDANTCHRKSVYSASATGVGRPIQATAHLRRSTQLADMSTVRILCLDASSAHGRR